MSTHHRPSRTLHPTIRPIAGGAATSGAATSGAATSGAATSGAAAVAEFAAPAHYDPADPVFVAHEGGKLAVASTKELRDRRDLSLLYTPGVADVCRAIAADPSLASVYTMRRNTVAVISDGTAVLGLGNIGPAAALPVMEGKAVLFKHFADVDAVPLCLETGDVDTLVDAIARLAPSYGGINLEDISAPRCFEIEARLKERLDIPVFHDDQHGTAIVVLAALINASRVVGKSLADLRVVMSGAGAAGTATTHLLLDAGVGDVIVADIGGIIHPLREDLAAHHHRLAARTNERGLQGPIAVALKDADVFVGLSGGTIPERDIARMASDAIIFALANPTPEVCPDVAQRHAAVVATGRSDYPNQINNVLAFPGLFRGALDSGARAITEEMKVAAAHAIAGLVEQPNAEEIIPSVFDERVAPVVAQSVAALVPRG